MLTEKQKEELLKLMSDVKLDEPLNQHTYFRIGGPAEAFLPYKYSLDYRPLKSVLVFCANENIPVTVLGGGSNVLILDEGLLGLVLRLDTGNIMMIPPYEENEPRIIQVDSGCSMQKLVKFTLSFGLTGLEPFLGLPGTVGGAVYNNAHFKRDQLFDDFVTKVWTIPFLQDNSMRENCYRKSQLEFGYDHSLFQSLSHKEIIILVEIALKKGDKQEVEALTEKLLKERRSSQPLDMPSSGCIFKNPENCPSAGWIIEHAGLKGLHVGGAEVSTKHANFIINPEKKATAADVLALMKIIHGTVLERFDILLEPEIFILGKGV